MIADGESRGIFPYGTLERVEKANHNFEDEADLLGFYIAYKAGYDFIHYKIPNEDGAESFLYSSGQARKALSERLKKGNSCPEPPRVTP